MNARTDFLDISQVTVAFGRSRVPVLNGIELKIARGEYVSVIAAEYDLILFGKLAVDTSAGVTGPVSAPRRSTLVIRPPRRTA